MGELCELANVLGSFGDTFEGVYDTMEPFIMNKINSLTEIDILHLIAGFYNPELSKRFKILDVAESIVMNQIDNMRPEIVENLLSFYTEKRMGSRILIETLKARVD